MPNESDAEEYGEEWEEHAESGNESDGHEELLVHPLPQAVKEERRPVDDDDLKKVSEVKAHGEQSRAILSDNDTASDSGESRVSRCSSSSKSVFPERIVKLHGRRVGRETFTEEAVEPPPAPTTVIEDVGVRAAVEARRRLHEYRREQQEKDEQMKMEEAALVQQMKQVRRMYKPFNRSIGVADIPPDKRYKEAKRRVKIEKQKVDAAVSEETSNRWYRKIKRQSHSGIGGGDYGARILDEARKEHRTKQRQKEVQRKEVEKKLKNLRLEAKRIAAETTCGYERGSYILKRAAGTKSKKKREQEVTENTQDDIEKTQEFPYNSSD